VALFLCQTLFLAGYIYSQKEKFKIQSGFGKFPVAIIRPKFKEKSPEFYTYMAQVGRQRYRRMFKFFFSEYIYIQKKKKKVLKLEFF
jgi:hypothetical protein